ncbi:hypothetical protein A2U01_0003011 [Trifolium medium]|uniref:Uncharacterized protein n=1 Tax=Trifolium medium TaxID=97028 RepID=A0A392M4H0_9FABA|nr:hypothetical protein [Trifolium medium]
MKLVLHFCQTTASAGKLNIAFTGKGHKTDDPIINLDVEVYDGDETTKFVFWDNTHDKSSFHKYELGSSSIESEKDKLGSSSIESEKEKLGSSSTAAENEKVRFCKKFLTF